MRFIKYTVKLVKESSGNYNINKKVTSPEAASDIIKIVLDLQNEAVEKFGILALDTLNNVIGIHIISIGDLNSTIVHPREVFKAAILNNACNIILFHNHPSGDTTASKEDIKVTKALYDAGNIIGIKVLDHIIIGNDYKSLKEEHLF